MKKIIVLIMIMLICLLSACSYDTDETYFNGAVETDSSISKITEDEAVNIVNEHLKYLTSKYDTYDASYFSDGSWHILFYNEPITCGGGIDIVIDENTKEIIDIIEQE
ncbi:MAG: hypothetical protein K2G73_07220 [Eubacterium sp.]|nr:hypothetical protein [Eubacterium sp.]